MKKILAVILFALSCTTQAQDASQYVKLKAAGKAPSLSVPTKVDPADINKVVADTGYVLMSVPSFDGTTGEQTGSGVMRVQIASKLAERAALVKQLSDLDALIADLKAAK